MRKILINLFKRPVSSNLYLRVYQIDIFKLSDEEGQKFSTGFVLLHNTFKVAILILLSKISFYPFVQENTKDSQQKQDGDFIQVVSHKWCFLKRFLKM